MKLYECLHVLTGVGAGMTSYMVLVYFKIGSGHLYIFKSYFTTG